MCVNVGGRYCDATGLSDLRILGTLHCVWLMARDLRRLCCNAAGLRHYVANVRHDRRARLRIRDMIAQHLVLSRDVSWIIAEGLRDHASQNPSWLGYLRQIAMHEIKCFEVAFAGMKVACVDALIRLSSPPRVLRPVRSV